MTLPPPQGNESDMSTDAADMDVPGQSRRRAIPTLRVVTGNDLLRFVTLSPNRQLRIGRDRTTDLVLTDTSVSKQHARIVVDSSGNATVFDLHSTNGTSVNRQRARRASLRPGDTLEVGGVQLRLELLSQDELNHVARVLEQVESPDRDPESGLLVASWMQAELDQLVERCHATGTPVSCLAVRVDPSLDAPLSDNTAAYRFVIASIARLVLLAVRDADPCIRYDRDTLVVFLSGSTEDTASEVAERIRRQIASHDWSTVGPELLVTASIGVAARLPREETHDWLHRALRSARNAHTAGRNRIERAISLFR